MKLRCRVLALAGVPLALAGCVHQAGLVICGRAGSPVVDEVAGGYRPSGDVQQLTGDYRAAAASLQQVMALNRDLDDRSTQAWVLNELGVLKQLTGNHLAAAVSHHQALHLFRDLDARRGQADVLNGLGELSSRTAETQQAPDYHSQALVIARGLCADDRRDIPPARP